MISDDYIMGFVEGEGCFSVAIQRYIDRKPRKTKTIARRKDQSIGFTVRPSFRITAVAQENAVLYAIKDRLGVGNIYTQKRGGNARSASHYYAQTIAELEKIKEFFSGKEFYTSKGESFRLWLECLKIIREGRHLTKKGLLEICELRDKMNFRLAGKNSRTTEMIKEILENKPGNIEAHANQSKLIHNANTNLVEKWFEKRQGCHRIQESQENKAQMP